jgi:hypothetical protein
LIVIGLLWLLSERLSGTFLNVVLKFLLVLSLTAGFAGIAHVCLGSPALGIDDADIFLVYAKNLAHGRGFVYAVGGERVEGFTSLLWVLMLSLFYHFTNEPHRIAMMINVLFVSGALTALIVFVDKNLDFLSSDLSCQQKLVSVSSVVSLIWVFSSPGYIIWTTFSLMETGLWSSLLLLATISILAYGKRPSATSKANAQLTVLIPLLILARPEGILLSLVYVSLSLMISLLNTGDFRASLKNIIPSAAACLLGITGVTLFRSIYFGFPLPNTYYAKMSPDVINNLKSGVQYFKGFCLSNVSIFVSLLAACWGLAAGGKNIISCLQNRNVQRSSSPDSPRALAIMYFSISSIILVSMAIPIYIGGDHFVAFRFYQPVWPLLALSVLFLPSITREHGRFNLSTQSVGRFKYVSVVVLSLFFLLTNHTSWRDFKATAGIGLEFLIAEYGRRTGEFLNDLFEHSRLPVVGVITAGGIQYTYKGKVFDLLGLNDVQMGHHRGDRRGWKGHASFSKEVFYSRQPDIVLFDMYPIKDKGKIKRVSKADFSAITLKNLFFEPRFLELYKLARVKKIDAREEEYLFGYYLTGFLNELSESGEYGILFD